MPVPLIIVESPTKAKTIAKFLHSQARVLSSFGHIRDLPKSKIGVDVEHDFEPSYAVSADKKKQVAELKAAAKEASEVILATDEDREGEAIAWHLAEVLGLKPQKTKRMVFHEITEAAIHAAMEHPRTLDMNLVNAQQARRILDRLVGYELSPLLWKKIRFGLSAGRVQSVAVRLIVERERERNAFQVQEYWTVEAKGQKDGMDFETKLVSEKGVTLEKLAISNEAMATKIVSALQQALPWRVASLDAKEVEKAPPVPFSTSALQIEANNRLGFSAKQTMKFAQSLYENGHITYMRTDSLNLAEAFTTATQTFLHSKYGATYATGVKHYKTKKAGAQEAHEAIRPTRVTETPEAMKKTLQGGEWRLYDLIWRRTVASQMPHARLKRTTVDFEAGEYGMRGNGSQILFDGYMKIYRSAQETILPAFVVGEKVHMDSIIPTKHETEPPARYSDATLVKVLEEHGIGRPSTYAPTIGTIIARGYVERDDNKKLYPTDTALLVTDLLKEHFPTIVDYEFTAGMEQSLDHVGEGQADWVKTLRDFYTPFHATIVEKGETVSKEEVMKERELGTDPLTGMPVVLRNGRFGPYVQLGDARPKKGDKDKPRRASLPKTLSIETVTLDEALNLLALPRTLGKLPSGEDLIVNRGRFGPYLKGGEVNISLPVTFDPLQISYNDAYRVFTEGVARKAEAAKPLAVLGKDSKDVEIVVKTGRYGPYVSDGTTHASIPKKIDPMTVTLPVALEMLEKKRNAPKRAWGGKKKKQAES